MGMAILASVILAFGVSLIFGKNYIPWLKKHRFTQTMKDEVAEMYSKKDAEDHSGDG